tara:strand:+ start:1758 stop:2234 length:477 start_codon:yes stop_codon:yes gene_type:complete
MDLSNNEVNNSDNSDNYDNADNSDNSDEEVRNEVISVNLEDNWENNTKFITDTFNRCKEDLYDINWLDDKYDRHKFTIRSVIIILLTICLSTMFHSLRLESHENKLHNINNDFSQYKKILDEHHESIHQLLKFNFIKQSETCQAKLNTPTYVPTPNPK